MFRQRYAEITRKRWYDVFFLFLISLISGIVWGYATIDLWFQAIVYLIPGIFLLLLSVYFLTNELTHRHRQAFVTAAAFGSMLGSFSMTITFFELWGYALLAASSYYSLRALRRYGAQWKDMTAASALLAGSLLTGGIWPLYNFALPFIIVGIIAIRPIMRYKKWSIPAATLLTIVLVAIPFVLNPELLPPVLQAELCGWAKIGNYNETGPAVKWLYLLGWLCCASVWLPLGLVSVGYSLRSQRIHGDLAGQIGAWWFILAGVLIMLRPNLDPCNCIALLIPFSFCIGAYTNLLSLPKKLVRNDRRVYRSTLAVTAISYAIIDVAFLCVGFSYMTSYIYAGITLFIVVAMVFLILYKYRKQKLSVRLTETGFIVLALLLAASHCFQ